MFSTQHPWLFYFFLRPIEVATLQIAQPDEENSGESKKNVQNVKNLWIVRE